MKCGRTQREIEAAVLDSGSLMHGFAKLEKFGEREFQASFSNHLEWDRIVEILYLPRYLGRYLQPEKKEEKKGGAINSTANGPAYYK